MAAVIERRASGVHVPSLCKPKRVHKPAQNRLFFILGENKSKANTRFGCL